MTFKAPLVAAAVLVMATSAHAQLPQLLQMLQPPPAPKLTKIEQFAAKPDAVIIRGLSAIGDVRGVSVEADEFTNVGDKSKSYGIKIGVKHGDEDAVYTFIDDDEIDALLSGIDSLSKVQKSATKLDNVEGTYRTRGSLCLTTFTSADGTVSASVEGGSYPTAKVSISLDELAKLADLIRSAQTTLNGLK